MEDVVCIDDNGTDDDGTSDVEGMTVDEQGNVIFDLIGIHLSPLSYVPSGHPQPSTTAPRQHRFLHSGFFSSQVSGIWLSL